MARRSNQQIKDLVYRLHQAVIEITLEEGREFVSHRRIAERTSTNISTVRHHLKNESDILKAWNGVFVTEMLPKLNFTSKRNFVDSWIEALDEPICIHVVALSLEKSSTQHPRVALMIDKLTANLLINLNSQKEAESALAEALGQTMMRLVKFGLPKADTPKI